jgi:hypothetical protein
MRPVARVDRGFMSAGIAMAIVGVALSAFGMGGKDWIHSYFFGYMFWLVLTVGCLGLTLLHHTARGHWGFPVVRIFEAGGGPLAVVLCGLGTIPIILNLPALYPWADAAVVAKDPILQTKSFYNNEGFWTARVVIAFAVLAAFAAVNQAWLRKEEQTGDPKWRQMRVNFSAPALVVFVLLVNSLFTDLGMSQEKHWFSTIYGVWLLVMGALGALGLASAILGTQHDKAPYDKVVQPWLTKDLGNLMLAFTMLWAYFSFSQYLIIWSGNLPEFTKFFLKRSDGMWFWLANGIMITGFFVPFLLLLAPRAKRSPKIFGFVGGYILVIRAIDMFFVTVPTHRYELSVRPADVGALLLLGGVWCAAFALVLRTAPLVTYRTPDIKEAAEHA